MAEGAEPFRGLWVEPGTVPSLVLAAARRAPRCPDPGAPGGPGARFVSVRSREDLAHTILTGPHTLATAWALASMPAGNGPFLGIATACAIALSAPTPLGQETLTTAILLGKTCRCRGAGVIRVSLTLPSASHSAGFGRAGGCPVPPETWEQGAAEAVAWGAKEGAVTAALAQVLDAQAQHPTAWVPPEFLAVLEQHLGGQPLTVAAAAPISLAAAAGLTPTEAAAKTAAGFPGAAALRMLVGLRGTRATPRSGGVLLSLAL